MTGEQAIVPAKRHVELAVAEQCLGELIEAAIGGERIFIDVAGVPQVQLVIMGGACDAYLDERFERKFGMSA